MRLVLACYSSVGRRWRPQKNLADPSQPTSPGVRSSARFSAPLSPGTPCGRRFPHVLTPRCGHASAPLLGELLPPPLLQPRARGISPARCELLTWFMLVRRRSTRGWRRAARARRGRHAQAAGAPWAMPVDRLWRSPPSLPPSGPPRPPESRRERLEREVDWPPWPNLPYLGVFDVKMQGRGVV